MDGENIEYSALMRVYDKLSTGIRAVLSSITEVALAKQLIHVSTLSEANDRHATLEERTRRFLLALGDRIRTDRAAFHLFVKILEDEYAIDYLGKILKESFEREKGRYEDLKKEQTEAAEQHGITPRRNVSEPYEGTTPLYPTSARPIGMSEYYHLSLQALHGNRKPGHLPLQPVTPNNVNGRPYYYIDGHARPQSEPANKFPNSPATLFLNQSFGPINCGEENPAFTRWAMTPGGLQNTSSTGIQPAPRVFKKTQSGLQMKMDFMNDPTSPSGSLNTHYQPPLDYNSHNFAKQPNATNSASTSSDAESLISLSTKVGSLSLSSHACTGDTVTASQRCDKIDKAKQKHMNDTDYVETSKALEFERGPNHVSGNEDTLSHELPSTFQKPKHGQRNPCDLIEIATTATMPEQKLLHSDTHSPPHVNGKNEESSTNRANRSRDGPTITACFGVSESHQGPHCLSCGHPLLDRSSSAESTNSPQPSPEVDPVQVSEKSPGEYHPLADSECSKRIARRRRCKQCEKLKKESDAVRVELAELQQTLKKDREQNDAQVVDLRGQLHRERLENYELKQRIYNSELRHQEATRTIQQLHMELQEMRKLVNIMEGEQAGLRNAYHSCYAKCELFKVRLQRADSMQCQDNTYHNNIVDDRHREQMYYGPGNGNSGVYCDQNIVHDSQ